MEETQASQLTVTVADCWKKAISQYLNEAAWLLDKYVDDLSFPHGFHRYLRGAFSCAAVLAWKVPGLDLASKKSLLDFIGFRFTLSLWANKLFASLDGAKMRGISIKNWPNRPSRDYFGYTGTSALETALKITLRVVEDSSLTGEAFHEHSRCRIWPCPDKAIAEWIYLTKKGLGVVAFSSWSSNDLLDQIDWMCTQMDSEYKEYLEAKLPATTECEGMPATETGVKLEGWHSPDFRSIRLKGRKWTFTPNQSKVIKILWEAKEKDEGALSEREILNMADLDADRLVDVFKVRRNKCTYSHEAWGTIVVRTGPTKGMYMLA